MSTIADCIVILVAILHLGFLALEMYFWQKPLGMKIFGTTKEFAKESGPLAFNQGLYNGFLAAGLFWGLLTHDAIFSFDIKVFFLACITIAGIFGGLTVKRSIFFIQALPAIIAILLLRLQ
jgi:putative membrane protein